MKNAKAPVQWKLLIKSPPGRLLPTLPEPWQFEDPPLLGLVPLFPPLLYQLALNHFYDMGALFDMET